jgi:hypothetical protein
MIDSDSVVWGFDSNSCKLTAKHFLTGLKVAEFSILISPSEIIDICYSNKRVFFLLYTRIHVLKLINGRLHRYDLPIKDFSGMIPCSNQVYLLSSASLKFDIKTKMVRKTSLFITNMKIITKTCHNENLFILANPEGKLEATQIFCHQTKIDKTFNLPLNERIEFIGGALSFKSDNEIFVFGGKLAMGWASSNFLKIEIENSAVRYLKQMIKPAIFNVSSLKLSDERVTAVDTLGFMHVYDRINEKWKIVSEKYWKNRKTAIWVWSELKKKAFCHPLGHLSLGLIKRVIIEFLN